MQGVQCMYCKHYIGMNQCPAYPDGIPEGTRSGADIHDTVRKAQVEPIVFEVNPITAEGWEQQKKLAGVK